MSYFKPSDYAIKNAIAEDSRYDGIYVGDNYVTKDHGDYIEICIDAGNGKGHISYDLYFDDRGVIYRKEKHNS